jgi:hypothetical protein
MLDLAPAENREMLQPEGTMNPILQVRCLCHRSQLESLFHRTLDCGCLGLETSLQVWITNENQDVKAYREGCLGGMNDSTIAISSMQEHWTQRLMCLLLMKLSILLWSQIQNYSLKTALQSNDFALNSLWPLIFRSGPFTLLFSCLSAKFTGQYLCCKLEQRPYWRLQVHCCFNWGPKSRVFEFSIFTWRMECSLF